MGIIRDADKQTTTLAVDIGVDGVLLAGWVNLPIDQVKGQLGRDGWIACDSAIGEIHVQPGQVKFLQTGKREINITAANRQSGSALV